MLAPALLSKHINYAMLPYTQQGNKAQTKAEQSAPQGIMQEPSYPEFLSRRFAKIAWALAKGVSAGGQVWVYACMVLEDASNASHGPDLHAYVGNGGIAGCHASNTRRSMTAYSGFALLQR